MFDITAIIYDKRGMVLSVGKNSYVKTHPLQKKYAEQVGLKEKEFLHAEVAAIIKCVKLEKAHKIKIFRFGAKNQPMMAKPCPICETAIRAAGIEIVEHT